jgi:hypothetical protein
MRRTARPVDRVFTVAITSEISHGAFRLYAIIVKAAQDADAGDEYFPVTLTGLMDLHPGIGGRKAGATTVIKQIAELRKSELIDTRAAIHRSEPRKPVLVRVNPVSIPVGNVGMLANQQ